MTSPRATAPDPSRPPVAMGGASEVGHVRLRNEDSYLLVPELGLLAVFDGLGGHAAGDEASAEAARSVRDGVTAEALQGAGASAREQLLATALQEAHRAVAAAAGGSRERSGMATTAVLAVVDTDGSVTLAHVGDSRAYVVSGGEARQVTRDHGSGGFITQALGLDRGVEPDTRTLALQTGDLLVLCTDGLTDMLDDQQIAAVAGRAGADAQAVVDDLVEAALTAGGIDNVTVTVAVGP